MSILPIAIILIILNFVSSELAFDDVSTYTSHMGPVFVSFLLCIIPLIVGMALFNIGAEKSTGKIGHIVGTTLTKRKTLVLLLIVALLMGFLVTLAEPDLSVLASRLYPDSSDGSSRWLFIIIAAIGVGVFLLVAILRVMFDKSIKYWLVMGYGLVFALGYFVNEDFFSVVFDAGGVTTGPVTVPFILSLGVGVASVLGGNNAEDDSFGYSGLCSLGTVLAVTVFGVFLRNTGGIEGIQDTFETSQLFEELESYSDIASIYGHAFLTNLRSVSISMIPITLFFLFYNFFFRLPKKEFLSVLIGLVYVFLGLVLFLSSAEAGLIPVASNLGTNFAKDNIPLWQFILVGFLFGFISMLAEPAVHVLADQVNEVSRGAISRPMIFLALCMATGCAIVINIIRVTYNIDMIYFVVPLLILALVLAFFSPDIYVAISIDSAGVATGTMASCFFLPMFIGYVSNHYLAYDGLTKGESILRNGFGIVGIMSLLPIICVEIVGIIGITKTKLSYRQALKKISESDDSQIIHLPI